MQTTNHFLTLQLNYTIEYSQLQYKKISEKRIFLRLLNTVLTGFLCVFCIINAIDYGQMQ